jgi:hypothetical protein
VLQNTVLREIRTSSMHSGISVAWCCTQDFGYARLHSALFQTVPPLQATFNPPHDQSLLLPSLRALKSRSSTEPLKFRGSVKSSKVIIALIIVVRLSNSRKNTAAIQVSSHDAFGSLSHLATRKVSQRTYATKTGENNGGSASFRLC